MVPSAERLLRPLLAFGTLCLAAFLLAPTVSSVHEKVEDLHIQRDTPWEIWKWTNEPSPQTPWNCGNEEQQLYSEVTQWPPTIQKDQTFTLGGIVETMGARKPVGAIDLDLFLNHTKSEPGVFLGKAESGADGRFSLTTSVPFDLQAQRYHLVAHAKRERIDCTLYHEHWSDPEIDVVSTTAVRFEPVERAIAGQEMIIVGHLDDAVGGPVKGANVTLSYAGKRENVTTDDEGAFRVEHIPERAGNLTVEANYTGGKYYAGSRGETSIRVLEEDVAFADLALLRSQPTKLAGHVYVAPDLREKNATLIFDGLRVAACEGCAPTDRVSVPLDKAGAFSVTLVAPASQGPGRSTVTLSGGGLKEGYTRNVTLEVPTILTLEADGEGLFARTYTGRAVLTDEIGRPVAGRIALLGPDGWRESATDPDGAVAFSGSGGCGRSYMRAFFNGTDGVRRTDASDELLVCGYLAFMPAWLLAIPWWIWPLAILGAIASWWIVRAWRQKFAPVIRGGPALDLAFTSPHDIASGYAAVGEAVEATAFLEAPLPDGHRLRLGTHRAMGETPIEADLRARLQLVPDKLGDHHVRAEIVDAKGRVVSRRTLPLRVIRYAHEIETRYLSLRAAHGAHDSVTPREFEGWLHERAPNIDRDVARRLVRVFEEADYSPRTAGRAEFVAYLAAEGGLQEVRPDARLA